MGNIYFVYTSFFAVIFSFLQQSLLTPKLDVVEGGAIEFYPFFLLSSITLVLSSFFLFEISRSFRVINQKIIRGIFIFLFFPLWIKIFSIFLPINANILKPQEAFPSIRYSSPSRESLEIVNFLNTKEPQYSVITNYWSINRNYSLTIFLKLVPFMSHPVNMYGFHQADYMKRRDLLHSFFFSRKTDSFFNELKESYPDVKYLFIDNSLLEVAYPGETTPVTWENHVFTDSIVPMQHIMKQPNIEKKIENVSKLGFNIRYANEHNSIIYIHLLNSLFEKCIREHHLKIIKKNNSATLYEIL